MRKAMAVLLVICSLLTGCSTISGVTKESPQNIRIGISVYDDYDTFISDMTEYIKEWARGREKATGITISLDIVSADGSQLTQNDQVEKFISKSYDAVCVNLVDRTDATVIIDKAKNADIPVIFFNRELVEEDILRWNKLYYVGANAAQSGEYQAEIVKHALDTRFEEIDKNQDKVIQYVILEGETGHQDALVRTQMSVDCIKNAGYSLEKCGDEIANWNRTQASSKMKGLLEKNSEIELVLSNDDDMALGAIDAYTSMGYDFNDLPLIVGVNGTKDALEMIRTNRMEGTVYNDAKGQADMMMSLCYGLCMEGKVPENIELKDDKYIYLDYEMITYDNVQKYIRLREKQ